MKKKSDSQKKGDILERFSVRLLMCLAQEWGFHIHKIRKEKSGAQHGKDVIYRISTALGSDANRYLWYFEDKNYKNKISSEKLEAKLNEAHRASSSVPIDCWCILLPKSQVSEAFSTFVDGQGQNMYHFKVVCWTADEEVEKLIACFPDLYKELYGKYPQIHNFDRQKTLEFWNEKFLIDSEEGKKYRLARTNIEVPNLDASAKNIASSIIDEIRNNPIEVIIRQDKKQSKRFKGSIAPSMNVKKTAINIQIDEALDLLNNWKIPEALSKFMTILPKVEEEEKEMKRELARIYNNIGVAYNRLDKIDLAVDYFKKSIKTDSSFITSLTNLASAYISQADQTIDPSKRSKLLTDASKIIDPLMKSSSEEFESKVIHAYLRLLKVRDGVDAVVSFVRQEANAKYSKVFASSSSLSLFLSNSFLEKFEVEDAYKYAEKSVELEPDVESYMTRGRVLLAKSLQEDAYPPEKSIEDLMPKFRELDQVELAYVDFQKATEFAIEAKDKELYQNIRGMTQVAELWLKKESKEIISEWPDPENKYVEAVKAFGNRDFEVSFDLLRKSTKWRELPPDEIWRLARAYLYNGAIEVARSLLLEIEEVAIEKRNFGYWLDRSVVETLLEDKDQAILAASRAKEFASTQEERRVAFSHTGAVLIRYAGQDGGDRLLQNALDFEKEFPHLDVLTRMDFERDKEALVKMWKDRYQWVTEIQKIYKENPIPSYYLQKIFRKPYVSVWSGRDPMMPMEYTIASEWFLKELKSNYEHGKVFVLDYVALLTLSKLNLLYRLENLFPRMQVPFSLFQKIQEELLKEENSELRKAWNFLRKSKAVEVIKNVPTVDFVGQNLSEFLEEWLLDVFRLAKQQGAILVTDDFRLYRLSKSENILPINSWFIINNCLENGLMDKVMYSKAIGSLAECFYTFLGFNAEDLYQIIADDDFKHTPRSYHLIHQVFLSGTTIKSFTEVFCQFIWNLWQSGALSEDKVYWLSYLTNIATDISNMIIKENRDMAEVGDISKDFGYMWNNAISVGRKEDLVLLRQKLDEILKGQRLEASKDVVIEKLDKKIAEMQ